MAVFQVSIPPRALGLERNILKGESSKTLPFHSCYSEEIREECLEAAWLHCFSPVLFFS